MNREPRTLYYIPIIHTGADMGSLAKTLALCGISQLGEKRWREHIATVQRFWDAVAGFMASVPAAGLKIYQDGLVADGEIGLKIVAAGVRSGSRNYQIVDTLLGRGAEIVQTENFNLVLEERDRLMEIIEAPTSPARIAATLRYRLVRGGLLRRRDAFIARRIDETLGHGGAAPQSPEREAPRDGGGAGVLFIGAYHRVLKKLRKDIRTLEVKSAERVRRYHELLPVAARRRQEFMELSRYLAEPLTACRA